MKLNHKKTLLICLLTTIALSSCSKDNDENTTTTTTNATTDVYVCGSTNDSKGDKVATIWKNGIPSLLTSKPGVQIIAEKVAISGNDVYAINFKENEIGEILLWKNGAIVQTISNNTPLDLKVDNNDVYILGKSGTVFKYWKNGDETILTNSQSLNQVTHMKVVNGDVYIAGSEVNGAGKSIAKLWKNGAATIISNSNLSTFVNGLDVNGTDIVVLLREVSASNTITLKTWKNGVINTIETGIFNDFNIDSGVVQMSVNDVFVAAKVPTSTTASKIVLWKNNTKTEITSTATTTTLFEMKVKENDVNILFAEKNPGSTGKMVLKLSKNSQTTILTTDAEGDVSFAAMAISNNGNVHISALGKYFTNNTSVGLDGLSSRVFGIFTVN